VVARTSKAQATVKSSRSRPCLRDYPDSIHDLRFTIYDFSQPSVFHQSLMAIKRNAATSNRGIFFKVDVLSACKHP
jgi:hypothetical protein